ncbi:MULTISPECIES: hypothetical protein [unclassified Lysinibacillus]|uniref:DUF7662 domain-containing protein n=1 Tax=unclassified Lysinibacillus TaxID=2636778 RepID=UPI0035DA0292
MRGEKYLQLQQFLKSNGSECITLSFGNIEMILGFKLPDSAYKYSAWWSNNIGSHTQAHSWVDAGYKTQSIQLGNQVIFKKDIIR